MFGVWVVVNCLVVVAGVVSVWCVAFFVDFGHIEIPRNLNVPPSLRMLGIEPQVLIFKTLHLIIQR